MPSKSVKYTHYRATAVSEQRLSSCPIGELFGTAATTFHIRQELNSRLDLIEFPCLHVVNEPTHGNIFRNPRVVLHFPHLLAHVLFKIIEPIEMGRFTGIRTHFLRQLRPHLVFLYLQQAAIGVIDDDEFLCVKQVMGHDKRTDRVIGGDASCIADHVRITRPQAKAMLEKDSRVHAGQDSGMASRADLQVAQVETARKDFVGG